MPYNPTSGEYERRATTILDDTPDGDTVNEAVATKLDTASDDSVTDLNHHDVNGGHYPTPGMTSSAQYLKKTAAGGVEWADGAPIADAALKDLSNVTAGVTVGINITGNAATATTATSATTAGNASDSDALEGSDLAAVVSASVSAVGLPSKTEPDAGKGIVVNTAGDGWILGGTAASLDWGSGADNLPKKSQVDDLIAEAVPTKATTQQIADGASGAIYADPAQIKSLVDASSYTPNISYKKTVEFTTDSTYNGAVVNPDGVGILYHNDAAKFRITTDNFETTSYMTPPAGMTNQNWERATWSVRLGLFIFVASAIGTGTATVTTYNPTTSTWTLITSITTPMYGVVDTGTAIIAVGDAKIYRSTDGTSFSAITIYENRNYRDVAYSTLDSMLIAVSATGTNRFLKSLDDGLNWSTVTGMSALSVVSIAWSPKWNVWMYLVSDGTTNEVYFASLDYNGVFIELWQPTSNILVNPYVTQPSIEWNDATNGFVFTNCINGIYTVQHTMRANLQQVLDGASKNMNGLCVLPSGDIVGGGYLCWFKYTLRS